MRVVAPLACYEEESYQAVFLPFDTDGHNRDKSGLSGVVAMLPNENTSHEKMVELLRSNCVSVLKRNNDKKRFVDLRFPAVSMTADFDLTGYLAEIRTGSRFADARVQYSSKLTFGFGGVGYDSTPTVNPKKNKHLIPPDEEIQAIMNFNRDFFFAVINDEERIFDGYYSFE